MQGTTQKKKDKLMSENNFEALIESQRKVIEQLRESLSLKDLLIESLSEKIKKIEEVKV